MQLTPSPFVRLARLLPAWDAMLVTALVALVALALVWAQFFPAADGEAIALPALSARAAQLAATADPVERDKLDSPLAAYGRALDRAVPADARVFLSGALGPGHEPQLRLYYFLRNYLFPRTVEISLDGRARFHESWFEGQPGDSAQELRARGFDLQLRMAGDGSHIELLPLTDKGVPR